MIVDANVILRAFFPDEAQAKAQAVVRDHVAGRIQLKAPVLLLYEVSNAVWQAERRGRVPRELADQIIQAMEGLNIELVGVGWGEALPLARRFGCSAYDAAYLYLAQQANEPFITGDLRLFEAVRVDLDWVIWINDYGDEG